MTTVSVSIPSILQEIEVRLKEDVHHHQGETDIPHPLAPGEGTGATMRGNGLGLSEIATGRRERGKDTGRNVKGKDT